MLYTARLILFLGKLKSRWSEPFVVTQVFPFGTIEISHPKKGKFKVYGHHLMKIEISHPMKGKFKVERVKDVLLLLSIKG